MYDLAKARKDCNKFIGLFEKIQVTGEMSGTDLEKLIKWDERLYDYLCVSPFRLDIFDKFLNYRDAISELEREIARGEWMNES